MILENYLCAVALLVLGFYAMIRQRNLFKIIIGMGLTDYGVNL